jgi:hypothetical protein
MLTNLDDDDDEQRILLADFGIARNVDDISGLTTTNMTVGNPRLVWRKFCSAGRRSLSVRHSVSSGRSSPMTRSAGLPRSR